MFFQYAFLFLLDALSAEVLFESFRLARPSAKIAISRWGKKVQGSGPEAPEMKKRRFDWKFPSGGPEKWNFFPIVGVFNPSVWNPAPAADPRRPPLGPARNGRF